MLGSCTVSDIAVKVLTRVIGHYPTQNMLLIDLGWTGCSAQGAEFGYGVLAGHPELKVVQLKQEAVRAPTPSVTLVRKTDGTNWCVVVRLTAKFNAAPYCGWRRERSSHLIMRR